MGTRDKRVVQPMDDPRVSATAAGQPQIDPSEARAHTPIDDVLLLVSDFLEEHGYKKAVQAILKESTKRGSDLQDSNTGAQGLAFPKLQQVVAEWKHNHDAGAESSSSNVADSDSSSDEDSDSDSEDDSSSSSDDDDASSAPNEQEDRTTQSTHVKQEMSNEADTQSSAHSQKRKRLTPALSRDSVDRDDIPANKRVKRDPSSSKSSSGSSSSSKAAPDNNKMSTTSSSSDDSSSSSESDSDNSSNSSDSDDDSSSSEDSSDSSSQSDEEVKLDHGKGTKGVISGSKASSAASTDSDTSSDSSSESESDASSDSSSESDSDGQSDSHSKKEARTSGTPNDLLPQDDVKDSDSSATLSKASPDFEPVSKIKRDGKVGSGTASATDAAQGTNGAKHIKKQGERFSRIEPGRAIDPRFASNAYNSYAYADKAFQDLSVTKGKGFTKEKNKKKRGSYRGGPIDLTAKAIKFDD